MVNVFFFVTKKSKVWKMPKISSFTPDCSENPFCFFFSKNKKIEAKAGIGFGKCPSLLVLFLKN
jgi:hypothetical protein